MASFTMKGVVELVTKTAEKKIKGLGKTFKAFGKAYSGQAAATTKTMGKVVKALQKIQRAAEDALSRMIEQSPALAGALGEITFMLDDVASVLGDTLAPIIEDFVIPILDKLVEAFMNLDPEIQFFIAAAIAIIANLPMLIGLVSALATVFTFLTGPIGLVVLAVVALALAWKSNLFGIRDATDSVWASLKENFALIWDVWGPSMIKVWSAVKEHFVRIWSAIKKFMGGWIKGSLKGIQGWIEVITGIFTGDMDKVSSGFGKIIEGMKMKLESALDFILNLLDSLKTLIKNIFKSFGVDIGPTLDKVFEAIKRPFERAKYAIVTIFDGIKNIVKKLFEGDIKGAFGAFGDMIKKLLNLPIDTINKFVIGNINNVLDSVAELIGTIPGVDKPSWKLKDIPMFEEGGFVDRTGQALVHAGEVMIPSQSVNALANLLKSPAAIKSIGNGGFKELSLTIHLNVESLSIRNEDDMRLLVEAVAIEIINKMRGDSQGGFY